MKFGYFICTSIYYKTFHCTDTTSSYETWPRNRRWRRVVSVACPYSTAQYSTVIVQSIAIMTRLQNRAIANGVWKLSYVIIDS